MSAYLHDWREKGSYIIGWRNFFYEYTESCLLSLNQDIYITHEQHMKVSTYYVLLCRYNERKVWNLGNSFSDNH